MLAPVAAVDPLHKAGNQKRREKAAWPKVFWLYDQAQKLIIGAAVFLKAESARSSDVALVWVTRVVAMVSPVRILPNMVKYFAAVFLLKGDNELAIRTQPAKPAGNVMDHFIEFVRDFPWKVFTVPSGFRLHEPHHDPSYCISLAVPRSQVAACGVVTEIIDMSVAPAPSDAEVGNVAVTILANVGLTMLG